MSRLRPRAKVREGTQRKRLEDAGTFYEKVIWDKIYNASSKVILDSAFRIHSALGPGLFEHVYEVILAYELKKQQLQVARQVPIPIVYDGLEFDEGYRADLVVEQSIIVELKSVEAVFLFTGSSFLPSSNLRIFASACLLTLAPST